MIKESNERISITLTKKQINWIRTQANRLDMRPSTFIKWLIDKNIAKLIARLPEDDLEKLIKLAKVKWLDFPNDEY